MDSSGLPSNIGESGTSFLKPEVAREVLFERILDQLADSSLFSSGLSPSIFIVYAHNNESEGIAYDECVRKLIIWLERIHAQILSDHSPLPPFVPRIEGTDPIGNILGNQMCLLPSSCYGAESPKVKTVDKVIVCGSEVMESYCRKQYAQGYIEEIVEICTKSDDHHKEAVLESRIRARVDEECDRDDFHHVLTELAFLKVNKARLPEAHGMVPVVLNQINPEEAPMRYLPVFGNTDVKLKLKSPTTSSLHRLFFKLLNRLFPEDKDFIQLFRDCYDSIFQELGLDDEAVVTRDKFDHIVNECIKKAHQQFWKAFCVIVRDGKLQAYAGKLSNQVSQVMDDVAQSTQHDILQWLSRHPASRHHGIYHDSGTARLSDTCDWVIQDEEFRRWYACDSSTLLFLSGDMGTGKTYATSRVIDWVQDGLSTMSNNEAFAYFYCNKQDPARSEAKEILRNIIRQLAIGPWKDRAKNTAVHKSVHELWLNDHTYPRTTIVLDALDECKTQQRQDLINLLIKLATREADTMAVKIFVSARPEEDIRRHLGNYQLIRMQEQHNAKDIAQFVQAKLAEHRRWSKLSNEIQKEMVDKLLEKSGDMFLFASLQIQQLRNCNTQSALRNRLSTLPNSLSKIYEEIYDRETLESDERRLLERALRWVLCSARPLTTNELLFAVSQDSESDDVECQRQDLDEEMILLWTQNLLSLDDSPGVVQPGPPVWRLAHQAVADFLENSTWCNSGLAHCAIGKVCLMMMLDTFGADTNETKSKTDEDFGYGQGFKCPCKPIISDNNRVHHSLPNTLLEYAFYGWPTHVRAQEDSVTRNVKRLSRTLRKFLGQPEEGSPAYKRWLDHACLDVDSVPKWSIFKARPMPRLAMTDTTMMAPVTLACHLGIYTCLLEWWDRANIDHDRVFNSLLSWSPTESWNPRLFGRQWSLVSLACLHSETNIIKHLLKKDVRVNTEVTDEVLPIVAAAEAGSVDTVKDLIEYGADIYSPFNDLRGTLLRLATRRNSLGLSRLLLQQPKLSQAPEVEQILKSFHYGYFDSAEAMAMLIDTGVNVNTPLSEGTLLLAAAKRGWEDIVGRLLKDGAEFDPQVNCGSFGRDVLECIFVDSSASPSIVSLLIEHGAHADSRYVTWAWEKTIASQSNDEVENWKQVLQLMLSCKPDLNERWASFDGWDTTALIEAVWRGDLDQTRLLLEHGAKVNLYVGNKYGDTLGHASMSTLNRMPWSDLDPADSITNVVDEGNASFQDLKGDRLYTFSTSDASVAADFLVYGSLDSDTCPIASRSREYRTALGEAAASDNPQAPAIVHTLLNNGPDINKDYGFFQSARMALDSPLCRLLDYDYSMTDPEPPLDIWLESASALALHNAVWDIDFMQWAGCLELRRPEFWEQNSEPLVRLGKMLVKNGIDFFLKFPEAAFDEEWRIKDAECHDCEERLVLRHMKYILGL